MKKFTCKEMGGPSDCDAVHVGEKAMDIAMKNHAHVVATTDDGHALLRKQMDHPSEDDQKKWWVWFNAEWNKKKDEA